MLRFATRFSRPNRVLLGACALVHVFAALNHAMLALRGEGDVSRHWAFVGINLVASAIVARAPRWAVWPMIVLALQQTWSHGNDLVRDGDLPSIGVLVFFPIVLTALVVERRRRTADRTERPREEPRG
jgi:hypothetical protein